MPPAMTPFSTSIVVYFGTLAAQIAQIQAAVEAINGPASPAPLLAKVTATQRQAKALICQEIPDLVMVETHRNLDSRLAFCQWVLQLSPSTTLAITDRVTPHRSWAYDVFLRMPFQKTHIMTLLDRLVAGHHEQVIEAGHFRLHRVRRQLEGPWGHRHLSPIQTDLMALFLSKPHTIVSREELMAKVWETTYMGDTRTLDVHMHWLRNLIEPDPSQPVYLETVYSYGYRFHPGGRSMG